MRNISSGVGSIIRLHRLILLLLPIVLAGCDWNDSKIIPDNLVGVWRTNDTRYRGRSLKLSKDSAVIDTGIGSPNIEAVESVKIQPVGEETNYSIKCRTLDGTQHLLSFRFSPKWGGELRLSHQQSIVWRHSRDTKIKPPLDVHVEDRPQPLYLIDCIHHICSLDSSTPPSSGRP
jgi:hypothetical protein